MKLRYLMTALSCVIVSSSLHAQSYEWVKTAKLGNDLHALFFLDSLRGWAAGTTSAIYKTTNGGTSWTSSSNTTAPMAIYSISFSDTLNGWCVGTDGSSGKIIHTSDGGKTWGSQFDQSDWYFQNTHAFSPTKNITVGYYNKGPADPTIGIVFQTLDGGKTWTNISPLDTNASYYHIQFLDSLNGFVWGYHGLRTRDGGRTWTIMPAIDQIQTVTFLDTLRGWGGYAHFMYHTTDGGQGWIEQADIMRPGGELYFKTISFLDSLKGWVFGNMPAQGIITEGIFRTLDGGWHWQLESVGLTDDFDGLIAGMMFNDHTGIALSRFGNVLQYKRTTSNVEGSLDPSRPSSIMLHQNYPNPFNPSTLIEYELPTSQRVWCEVTNALGEHVRTILDGVRQASGTHRVEFDGRGLPSGTYFYTLRTEHSSETKAMTLMK